MPQITLVKGAAVFAIRKSPLEQQGASHGNGGEWLEDQWLTIIGKLLLVIP